MKNVQRIIRCIYGKSTTVILCVVILASTLVSTEMFRNTYADMLPAGTTISTGAPTPTPEFIVVFTNPGPQTHTFPDPQARLDGIWSSVTTFVQEAVLSFDSDGITYSASIQPNSNTLFTFPAPLVITNVRLSIQDRGFADDAGHVAYALAPLRPPVAGESISVVIEQEVLPDYNQPYLLLAATLVPVALTNAYWILLLLGGIAATLIFSARKLKGKR